MDFGKLSPSSLNDVDFKLRPDSASTKAVLEAADKRRKFRMYFGCAKWGRKEWVGKIYPKATKEADFLQEYVKHFNSIELNATHYKIYGPDQIQKWAEKAEGESFLFCPKFPQSISHYSNLATEAAFAKTDEFFKGILAFGDQLGPVFLQLSERYAPSSRENLYNFLRKLPSDLSFFLELRHPSWFSDKKIRSEWLSVLKELNIGAVITDAAGRRDCAHMELTIPRSFIRFVGNNLHASDYTRVDAWIRRIAKWMDAGLKELYFFMHQPDEEFSPELSKYFVEQMNKRCGTDLPEVKFMAEQKSLF